MNTQIKTILDQFKEQKILVIGDFILDIYLDGTCDRLAPESNIPVLDITTHKTCLGGSANVAANLHALGAHVCYMSVMGQDQSSKNGIELLQQKGIDSMCIHFSTSTPTLTKTRLYKDHQLLYRIDVGKENCMEPEALESFLRDIEKAYFNCNAIYISDYNKGTINQRVIDLLQKLQHRCKKTIAIDAKDYNRYKNLHPTIIKPNYQESLQLLKEIQSEDRVQQAMQWGNRMRTLTQSQIIAFTLDKDGLVLSKKGQSSFHYPVRETVAKNVSGAGDTFLASFLLAYMSGATEIDASRIACSAACVSIQKNVTASCSISELQFSLITDAGKVLVDTSFAPDFAHTLAQDKKVVFTNGCFDIFHSGHAHYLQQARMLGDILVVGINTDDSVCRLKGPQRPINTLEDRMEVLKGLSCVDYIIPFGQLGDDTPINLIEAIQPSVYVKGEDYKNQELPEQSLLEALGVEVKFLPYIQHQSTTKIIARVQKNENIQLKKIS